MFIFVNQRDNIGLKISPLLFALKYGIHQNAHMYLTAIIDWYSRMIVGWNLSDTLDTGYVIQAVKDAAAAHGTPAILNSDQGGPLHQQRSQNAVEGASHPAEHGR